VSKIRANLATNKAWIERALVVLHDRQTTDEQATQHTAHDNNKGFNKPDARRMSFVASFLKSGGHLTEEKALTVYGPRLQKYAKQLARIAQEKKAA
jgi:hypothetical protein